MDKDLKKEMIANYFRMIMETLWLDMNDSNFKDTPKRVSKMFVDEIFSGLDKDNYPVNLMSVPNSEINYNQMVIIKDIKVVSVCGHHFMPIHWICHIAYIPNKKVLWLSKFARIVRFFSKKPQIQEWLTEDIQKDLVRILETEDVAVIIKAKHYCMVARWVEEDNSETITSRLWWAFLQSETRAEFYNLLK